MSHAWTAGAPPTDFVAWIDSIKDTLVPPVANKLMFGSGQHKIMIVGGPNSRDDYHMEEGEELFYMIKGDMQLNVYERGTKREIPIREGEFFLLPSRVPHSPQRFADTIGLVIERERLEHEMDGLRWYTKATADTPRPVVLYQDFFHCVDLGTQLKPIIEAFFASEACKTDTPAGEYKAEDMPIVLDTETRVGSPANFREWAAAHCADGRNRLMYGGADGHEYSLGVFTGPEDWTEWKHCGGECFLWQFEGEATLTVKTSADAAEERHVLGAGQVYMLPAGGYYRAERAAGTLGIAVTNKVITPSCPSFKAAGGAGGGAGGKK